MQQRLGSSSCGRARKAHNAATLQEDREAIHTVGQLGQQNTAVLAQTPATGSGSCGRAGELLKAATLQADKEAT
jgi:hypothetical protein